MAQGVVGAPCRASDVVEAGAASRAGVQVPDCGRPEPRPAASAPAAGAVPLTEGRDLVSESAWNGWVDLHHIDSADRRNGLDVDSATGGFTVGADRMFGPDFVAGLSLSLERGHSDSFDGDLTTRTQGYLVGPYVAYRLSDHWAVDAGVALGRYRNDSKLDVLSGSYDASRYTLAFNANGQYEAGPALVRPRFSAYFARTRGADHVLQGMVEGAAVTLCMPQTRSDYGMVEGSAELTQVFMVSDGKHVVAPYARLALRYEFVRANDGEFTGGDLSTAQAEPWGGSLRVGLRTLASRSTMIEAEAVYLSLGQPGLDVWEARLDFSHAF